MTAQKTTASLVARYARSAVHGRSLLSLTAEMEPPRDLAYART